MYPLVVLSLIAVALLLASRTREGLEPTDKIKAPPYDTAETDRIWAMIPETEKTAFKNAHAGLRLNLPSGMTLDDAIKIQTASDVGTFYLNIYKTATSPITLDTIDNWIRGRKYPGISEDASFKWSRAVLKSYFIDQTGGSVAPALGATTPTPNSRSGNQAPSPMRYEQLRKEFETKKAEYDAYIEQLMRSKNPTEEDITKIRNLNRKMFQLLEQSIAALGDSQSKSMSAASRELSDVLARVEREYNALSQNSDRVETLRRIRQFEEVRAGDSVGMYMILLIILAIALLVAMVFSQRVSTTTAIPPASPASTASLI